jgi:hypothetical protein
LLSRDDPALVYFVRRDLLGEDTGSVQELWDLPEARGLARAQQPDGSWRYPRRRRKPLTGGNYDLLESFRSLGVLVEMYGFDRSHPLIVKAAGYIFSCQTAEGDLRGILGRQFMPYYMGAILALLVKAGYAQDRRIQEGFSWLLSMRQEDGGWIIPMQAVPSRWKTPAFWAGSPLPPDRSRPSSHLATDMVLRAFAAAPAYLGREEILRAARLLKSRFFQADHYHDRRAASYWLKFQFPFWWNNLLSALDSLSFLGFDRRDKDIARGLQWFLTHQAADGLWETGYGYGRKAARMRAWVGLAVCRMLKRFRS